uniref:Uncharacterized protein n=1 Tax=Anguilla anguilla TaxID=7936 RepID=A0A0E9UTR9_ANGAN
MHFRTKIIGLIIHTVCHFFFCLHTFGCIRNFITKVVLLNAITRGKSVIIHVGLNST